MPSGVYHTVKLFDVHLIQNRIDWGFFQHQWRVDVWLTVKNCLRKWENNFNTAEQYILVLLCFTNINVYSSLPIFIHIHLVLTLQNINAFFVQL